MKNQIVVLHNYITQVEKSQEVQTVEIVELRKQKTHLDLENSRLKEECERHENKERELQQFIV